MKAKIYEWLFVIAESVVIVFVVLFCISPVSCRFSESGIQILSGDYSPPKISDIKILDSRSLQIVFSEAVDFESKLIDKKIESEIETNVVYNSEKNIVHVNFSTETLVGRDYELFGVVTDKNGNSLTLSMPFKGYNSEVPKIIMTEIQTESVSSRTNDEKKLDSYRNEFIEFLCLSDGNLSGLEIVSACDGEEGKFVFPDVRVKQGEIFVVHMRKRGFGCVNELEEDLSLAQSSYCKNTIRDLWTDRESTALGNLTDVIIVKNSFNGCILDGIMYCKDNLVEWDKQYYEFARLLESYGIYESCKIENASLFSKKSNTKTLQRVDAKKILNKVLNGEDFTYPIMSDENSWIIDTETHGSL